MFTATLDFLRWQQVPVAYFNILTPDKGTDNNFAGFYGSGWGRFNGQFASVLNLDTWRNHAAWTGCADPPGPRYSPSATAQVLQTCPQITPARPRRDGLINSRLTQNTTTVILLP